MTTQILRHEQLQLQAWPTHHTSWLNASAWSHGGGSGVGRLVTDLATTDATTSWEVRAFAEDASCNGQWPPRSYSCSFCQREFRTAQALGGHMNVHRRERAHQNQLAQIRNARVQTAKSPSRPSATVELLSSNSRPESLVMTNPSETGATLASLPSSSPSQESINSAIPTTKPLLDPDTILSPSRRDENNLLLSWSPSSSRALHYHPYEKPSATAAAAALSLRCKPSYSGSSLGRFSLCLNKVMGEVHEDALVDLELRLGRSSCAV